jgi:hypothetical protein
MTWQWDDGMPGLSHMPSASQVPTGRTWCIAFFNTRPQAAETSGKITHLQQMIQVLVIVKLF